MTTRRHGISRRTLLRRGAVAAAGLSFDIGRRGLAHAAAAAGYVPRPPLPQYVLRIGATALDPDGKQAVKGVTANGVFPGPEIRVRQGDLLQVRVENLLEDEPTSIHWHGLLLPAAMDGVPEISNFPIAPKGVFVYEFPIRQSGTYWYHSHWGFQEQVGLGGPFVIEEADAPKTERDAVVMISDWMHASPKAVYDKLRGGPAKKEAPPMKGMKMGGSMPGGMKMSGGGGADLSDIKYDAFLMNGRSMADPWTLSANAGERIRLRLINAGASTYFRIRLDGHPLQVTHADGLAVQPVEVDHLLMGMAECYDVVVALKAGGSYTLHAVAQDGSGQALGVLHTPDVAPKVNLEMPRFDGRELTYAALSATAPTTLPEGPDRTHRLVLGGDMARYVWTINGQAYPKADPLPIRLGERVRLEMRNTTMMWHPMHLHGHFFRVLQGANELCPLKHTVNVAPSQTVTVEFTADNPGNWFFHCHNLYHLEAGMARVFHYVA